MLGLPLSLLSGQSAVTQRKPIVLVGNNTIDLPPGDDVGDISYSQPQTLTAAQKAQAAVNGGFVQNGSGTGQNPGNAVKLGWNTAGTSLKATVDAQDLGQVWTDYVAGGSLAIAGYQRLASGLILQWTAVTMTGDQAVTLPVAFPSKGVFCGGFCNTSYSATALWACQCEFASTSQVNMRPRNVANGGAVSSATSTYSPVVYIFALGY